MEDKDEYTYLLRPSNSDKKNSLSVTYKNDEGVHQLKVRQIEGNKWYTEWENEDGEPEEITKDYVEDVINEIFSDEYEHL